MKRLLELYKKTKGGHVLLSDADYEEYATLRKHEFQDRRDELLAAGCINVQVCKDDQGDIIGWTFEDETPLSE